MRTLLRTVLGCTVMAGALFAATPAQASTCPAGYHFNDMGNGAGYCASNPSGGGSGGPTTVNGGGGGGSYGEPMAPPVAKQPAAPVYGPAPVQAPPAAPGPAPYVAPKAPAYVAPAPAQVNGPAAPVPAPNQPVKGVAPAENPVIAGVPAEAPAAEAAPAETPAGAEPSAAATAPATTSATSATPSPTATPAAGVTYDPAASTERFDPLPYILSGLLIAALAAVLVARARTNRLSPEAVNGSSMEAGSSDA